jgi:hypothetical protein
MGKCNQAGGMKVLQLICMWIIESLLYLEVAILMDEKCQMSEQLTVCGVVLKYGLYFECVHC